MRQRSHRISNLLIIPANIALAGDSSVFSVSHPSSAGHVAVSRLIEKRRAHFTVVIGNECSAELGKQCIHKQEHYLLGISAGNGTNVNTAI